jgi:act minimal PKS chain-length factor (CLF/KS beta)
MTSTLSRAVITGIGVVAPTGIGIDEHWTNVLTGVNPIAPLSRFDATGFPAQLAAEVPPAVEEAQLSSRISRQTDRITRLSLIAADLAMADAALDPNTTDEYSVGVAMTSTAGGLEFGQRELQKLWGQGWESVSAYMSFAWFYAVHAGQISIKNGLRGPGGVVVAEQAGGVDCLALARRQVRKGTPHVVTGAIDGSLCPYGMAIQAADRDLSRSQDPDRAFVPFDIDASGYVIGEGGAILVVEDSDVAAQRGTPQIYGVIAGYGATFDPQPYTSGADGLRRAILKALQDADLDASDVDVVFADAFGVRALDDGEADVLVELFGSGRVPIAIPKTMTGRLMSGGAPLDVATALLCMREGVVPAAINLQPDTHDSRLDIVIGQPRELRVRTALVLARGHGGFASAIVLRAVNDQAGERTNVQR